MIEPSEYTILLAEDDDEVRKIFIQQLEEKGFSTLVATEGRELYEKAMSFPREKLSHLVICSDTDIPNGYGDIVCNQLLHEYELFNKVIIIGMSGEPINESYWDGIGVWNSFIYKSYQLKEKDNFAEKVINRINSIVSQPQFYLLSDGTYRRNI